jgi:hypothetical protein
MIRTHDGTNIDWHSDPLGSAFSVADNTALFEADKLPPVFRDNPKNVDVLFQATSGKISIDDAKAQLRENVKAMDISEGKKARFMQAVDEVSPYTGKVTVGMLGGDLKGVEWENDHLVLSLKEAPDLTKWHALMDLGQRQFGKFAESYGQDPEQFKKSLDFKFTDKTGNVLLEGKVVK